MIKKNTLKHAPFCVGKVYIKVNTRFFLLIKYYFLSLILQLHPISLLRGFVFMCIISSWASAKLETTKQVRDKSSSMVSSSKVYNQKRVDEDIHIIIEILDY